MFNNRFNSSKNDPLVEAVKAAGADGDTRRLAESMTNGLFGVFSRQAVVREHLSDYDFALEEAYKCMSMKEEDKMADKDYDRDGKVETSKKEVWGSRLRAAKASGKYKGPVDEDSSNGLPPSDAAKQAGAAQQAQTPSSTPKRTGNAAGSTISNARDAAGMNEAQLDELKKPTAKTAMDAYHRAYDSDVRSGGEGKRTARLGRWKQKNLSDKSARNQKDTGKAAGMNEEQIDELTKPTAKTAMAAFHRASDSDVQSGEFKRSNRLYNWKQKNLPGKSARNQKDTGKAELDDYDRKTVKKGGTLTKASQKDTKGEIKSRLGKHTKPKNLPEEHLDEATRKHFRQHAADIAKISDQGERNKAASAAASTYARLNPRFDHAKFHSAAGSTAHQDQKVSMKESVLAKLYAKHMKEDQSFKAAQETGKSVNEVAMGVPPAITPPVISRPAKSTSGMKAPTGSFRGAGAQPLRTSSTQVNFNSVKPSAGYNLASRMSAAGRDAAGSRASNLGGMNAVDRIGGAIKSAPSSSSAKAMVDGGRAAVSRGVGALGAGARIARGAVGGPTGAALTAATIAAPYVASKMAASHKAGSTATPGVSTHQQTPDVKASDSFSRMRGMSQTSTASSTPAATAASKPAIDPTAKGAKYAGGNVHNVTTLKQTAPGDQAQIQSVKTEKGWADPGRWENEVKSKTGEMQQIRTKPDRHVVDTATQQIGKQSASDEKSTSNFLQSQGVGTSTQSQDTPAKASVNFNKKAVQENDEKVKAPKPMMTTFSPAAPMGNIPKMSDHPPSSLKEEVTVGNNKYRIV
jgi:hypothetical protein